MTLEADVGAMLMMAGHQRHIRFCRREATLPDARLFRRSRRWAAILPPFVYAARSMTTWIDFSSPTAQAVLLMFRRFTRAALIIALSRADAALSLKQPRRLAYYRTLSGHEVSLSRRLIGRGHLYAWSS